LARKTIESENVSEPYMRKTLELFSKITDTDFKDKYSRILFKDFEERSESVVRKVLEDLRCTQIVEDNVSLQYLLNYIRFKDIVKVPYLSLTYKIESQSI
jgi:hypothetical protein